MASGAARPRLPGPSWASSWCPTRRTRCDATMPIERLREPPHSTTLAKGSHTLYEVALSTAPSLAWRAAFLRPPPRLTTATATPERARLDLRGTRVTFRTTPPQLHRWLRRIDRWIAYANSVVEE